MTTPPRALAGSAITATWTGPDNKGDYIAIARQDASADATISYVLTSAGPSLQLTAPIEPGPYELRYITARSRTILARAAIEITAAAATLEAQSTVVLGAAFPVTWTGPNNAGDSITIVAKDAPDNKHGHYTQTAQGSPLKLTAPGDVGDAEIRYITGQGHKVLARRPIKVVAAEVTLSAPAQAVAGSTIVVEWVGPNNSGDYITIVPKDAPDDKYTNYTQTSQGSPLKLLLPVISGDAELRYILNQGRKVLARRAITLTAPPVTLEAPAECKAGQPVRITWTGPNYSGDYLTIVARAEPDGKYGAYTTTAGGSPLTVAAPKEPGDAEIRYMTGQGRKVLARRPIKVQP